MMIGKIVNALVFDWVDTFYRQWLVVANALQNDRLFFGSKNNEQASKRRLPPSFWFISLPTLVVTFFGLRASICVISFAYYPTWSDTVSERFWLGTQIFPLIGRANMEMCYVLWSAIYILAGLATAGRSLLDFKFLALLVVDEPEANITPEDLHLSKLNFKRLVKYRLRSANLVRTIVYSVSYGAIPALIGICVKGGAFRANFFATLFWMAVIVFWVAYVSCAVYGLPVLFSIVVYYFRLKQENIVNRLDRFETKKLISRTRASLQSIQSRIFLHFNRVNREYIRLSRELADYNRTWPCYLSILVNLYSYLVVYLTYLIFLNNLPRVLSGTYWLVLNAHVLTLCLVLRCSLVSRADTLIVARIARLQRCLAQCNYVDARRFLKANLMVQGAASARVGFSTLSGEQIETRFYLDIFINITSFFFLFFKNQQK